MRIHSARLQVILLLVTSTMASAETLTTKCAGQEFGKPYDMTMVYEGGDSGTMTITGSFGEMSLPAAKKQRDGVNADGDNNSSTEIWASGEVPLIVPQKAAIESCIKGKLTPEQVTHLGHCLLNDRGLRRSLSADRTTDTHQGLRRDRRAQFADHLPHVQTDLSGKD